MRTHLLVAIGVKDLIVRCQREEMWIPNLINWIFKIKNSTLNGISNVKFIFVLSHEIVIRCAIAIINKECIVTRSFTINKLFMLQNDFSFKCMR
ncbi:CLUMA_CG010721, isoform A [Clunio marinus]|uniref:CLUMA_CG010721, isoform A n=1 Tax=Clunio marinus TaxID=568069 RepID=A0A1J1IAQ5_9DIPT|nr:CLUMA_CG010721, isoform A [Clunio marinus]